MPRLEIFEQVFPTERDTKVKGLNKTPSQIDYQKLQKGCQSEKCDKRKILNVYCFAQNPFFYVSQTKMLINNLNFHPKVSCLDKCHPVKSMRSSSPYADIYKMKRTDNIATHTPGLPFSLRRKTFSIPEFWRRHFTCLLKMKTYEGDTIIELFYRV